MEQPQDIDPVDIQKFYWKDKLILGLDRIGNTVNFILHGILTRRRDFKIKILKELGGLCSKKHFGVFGESFFQNKNLLPGVPRTWL